MIVRVPLTRDDGVVRRGAGDCGDDCVGADGAIGDGGRAERTGDGVTVDQPGGGAL